MAPRLRSRKSRPIHMGHFETEKLARVDDVADPVPPFMPLEQSGDDRPLARAMQDHRAMLDAIRDGLVNRAQADIPADLAERAEHLKAFAHFNDATMVGLCRLDGAHKARVRVRNPHVARLAEDLKTRQVKSLASGIDAIMAGLREAMAAPDTDIEGHTYAPGGALRTGRNRLRS